MANIRNQILILEDDDSQAKALSEAFKRDGFVVHSTNRPAEAESILTKESIGTLFIDCLLPELSGVEFVENIRSKYPPDSLDVILMSGIFTDPVFVKESLRSTKAKHFLKKPFELSEALGLVEKPVLEPKVAAAPMHPRKALYYLQSRERVSAREKKKTLESLDEIYGLDLPYIYNLLVESKVSGHLNIGAPNGDIYGITFSQGNIVNVDLQDKGSYLGQLLLEGGYIHPDDLKQVTTDNTPGKKMGEKLISGFYISPHALDIALRNQMNIRLSKTIVEDKLTINFVESEVELTNACISPEAFVEFLHDWIASKVSALWLRAHYIQWDRSMLVKTVNYRPDHPALKAPLIASLPGVYDYLSSGKTVGSLLGYAKYDEDALHKALHYLLIRGLLGFSEPTALVSNEDRTAILKKLFNRFRGLNKIDIFDVMTQMVGGAESDADFVMNEFSKILGPKPDQQQKEIFALYQQVAQQSLQAYEFSKSGNREKLKEELAKGDIELKLKAFQNFDEAKNLLQKSAFKQALELLKKIQTIDPKIEKLRLYIVWAKLGLIDANPKKIELLKEIDVDLLQIPTEEKYDAVFPFIQGLLAKAKGNLAVARKNFEKAISLDAAMIVARRELAVLSSPAAGQKKDMFNRDLKDLVGSFFNKK